MAEEVGFENRPEMYVNSICHIQQEDQRISEKIDKLLVKFVGGRPFRSPGSSNHVNSVSCRHVFSKIDSDPRMSHTI